MREFYNANRILIEKLLFLGATVIVLFLFFNTVFGYVAPFVFGFLLSLILNPLVRLVMKYLKVKRGFATIIAMLLFFAVVGVLSTSLVMRILEEGRAFIDSLPSVIDYVSSAINDLYTGFNNLYNIFPNEFQQYFGELNAILINSITSLLGSGIKTGSTSLVTIVPNFLLGFVMCMVSSFFFVKDRELINKSIAKLIPAYFMDNYNIVKKGIAGALAGYLKAQLILMSIVGCICVVGLLILRVPYALFLGIIIAIVDALPVFGSGFFYWPWIAFTLITGDIPMAVGLSIIYVAILLTRQILEPKVLGQQIGIHPLLTLMSVYIGLRVFGVFGIFIGPCIMVIIKAIIDAPVTEKQPDAK